MRPAVSMSPMHCVHADFVQNVVGALKLGNKQLTDHHERIVPLLIAVALYLIFFVLLAHFFLLCVRLRQLLPPHSSLVNDVMTKVSKLSVDGTGKSANVQQCGATSGGGCGTENGYGQTEFNSNAKYIAHQHQNGGAAGIGQMLLNQSQEFHHTPFTLQMQNLASFHH
ncbi:hypothetical protein niasHS_009484 [Heterodera schachtii]|uniref:Uncharacterized protein n=1 Tax=Heterodera schachtii TaxID=97005 RepID=A0ABD2J705_HETSC